MIIGIDPGPLQSGWCLLGPKAVIQSGVLKNDDLLSCIAHRIGETVIPCAIEMIYSYGMPVGKEVFDTCVWIGRFIQVRPPDNMLLIYRKDIKLHLCGSPRAKDANIRQALIDRLGAPGTKKQPGPTHGVKSHAWSALAVAVTALDQLHARR